MHKFTLIAITAPLFLSACARDLDSNSYPSSATSGVVLQGTIISARPVTVTESDRLGGNTTGALAGGVGGGVAGNALGTGHRTLATVGGVVVGAVAGAAVEDALSKSDGMEYLIKIERKNGESYAPKDYYRGKKVSSGGEKPGDEIISVVQGKDRIFTSGQKVYIIYADDRPRVAPRE